MVLSHYHWIEWKREEEDKKKRERERNVREQRKGDKIRL